MSRYLPTVVFKAIISVLILTVTTASHANPMNDPPRIPEQRVTQAAIPVAQATPTNDLLQFTSAGHVLGFRKDSIFIATGTHALRVTFEGTAGVMPVVHDDGAINAEGKQKKTQPLQKVTYPNLWKDIDLTYDAPADGIARSTYTVRPHADPDRIRLKYNAAIQILNDGSLQLLFKNGIVTESQPVAWQIIEHRKTDVSVKFKQPDNHYLSFDIGAYDPSHTLFIDPTMQRINAETLSGRFAN